MHRGTYRSNRRAVYTTAPDCLVYINGETSLPSGSNPNRRVDIQPFVNSVSVNAGLDGGSGSATLSLHIPAHHMNDLYSGGQLSLTTMMEVKIYMKGYFTVGGAPQYYPVFWGLITSLNESYSAGEHTVSLSCSDMLHWWSIQQINVNPSWLESTENQQAKFNLEGNAFTGMNPFSIMYTLARRVYGDSMNVRNTEIPSESFRSEPSLRDNKRLQAYWAARWGRIANSLRMYGPTGDLLQGDELDYIIDPNGFRRTERGRTALQEEAKFYEPFTQGDMNFASISPFSMIFSQLQSLELSTNEFETKMNLANMVKEAIGYEFFMDVTGEIIFKPPFYNLDVRPNYPVSWIRDIDVISWNFAENEPDVTFLEATGFRFANRDVGMGQDVQPNATYVDYRLVQKYGWRPGSFSSEFIGSDDVGGIRALFFHLVDVMDRQNARVNNGTVTIPLRPELRVGYPVYIEGRDAYYYVESIAHTFSYGSRCTTQLTLSARRQKFYGAFDRWSNENQEPRPGDVSDPGVVPSDMYKRDIDPVSGTPEGDRNVIMTYIPENVLGEQYEDVEAFQSNGSDTEVLLRNMVNLRSQFGTRGDNKYVYMVDPNRDVPHQSEDTGERQQGPITHIEANPQIDVDSEGRELEVNAVVFPVSDERGYEVVGTYEYGRRVTVGSKGFIFDKQESDVQVESLLFMEPEQGSDGGSTTPNVAEGSSQQAPTTHRADPNKDKELQIDPNNYGRTLTEVAPPDVGPTDMAAFARVAAAGEEDVTAPGAVPTTLSSPNTRQEGDATTSDRGIYVASDGGVGFRYDRNVGRYRQMIRDIRADLGLSEEDYPDEWVLGFIHTESDGDPNARRRNKKGEFVQYVGLLQIGKDNAADLGRTNTDFMGDPELSIRHFFEYQELYKDRHQGDPDKQAMLWKMGPGATSQYNRLESSGASQEFLNDWIANYPPSSEGNWNSDEYISRKRAATQVWAESLDPIPEIPEGLDPTEVADLVNNAVTEAARASDAADDPEERPLSSAGLPDNEEELAYERQLFEEKLQENRDAGIVGLPEGMKPPRDPSIAPVITNYLKELYEGAFGNVKEREERLRGHTRAIPRVPDAASIPTSTPEQDRRRIDNPLGRQEVRDALDGGATYNELFDVDGIVDQLMGRVRDSVQNDEDE